MRHDVKRIPRRTINDTPWTDEALADTMSALLIALGLAALLIAWLSFRLIDARHELRGLRQVTPVVDTQTRPVL